MESAPDRGFYCCFIKTWPDNVVSALKQGPPPHKQIAPLAAPVLRRIGAAAATKVDFVLVLSRIASLFSVPRAHCFLNLQRKDIKDMRLDRVCVFPPRLKGKKRCLL